MFLSSRCFAKPVRHSTEGVLDSIGEAPQEMIGRTISRKELDGSENVQNPDFVDSTAGLCH